MITLYFNLFLFTCIDQLTQRSAISSSGGIFPTAPATVPLHRSGERGTGSGQEELVFAKSASNPCVRVVPMYRYTLSSARSNQIQLQLVKMVDIVVSTTKSVLFVFNKAYELVAKRKIDNLTHSCVVVDDSNNRSQLTMLQEA